MSENGTNSENGDLGNEVTFANMIKRLDDAYAKLRAQSITTSAAVKIRDEVRSELAEICDLPLENHDNTTHSTTFSKGYAAVEMEYESGRMSNEDYLAFLAMLAYLYNKKSTETTDAPDTDIDAIRRTVLDSEQRIKLRRVLRGSSTYLRAPRPKPMGHYVKDGEKVDEMWIENCGAGRDEIAKELEGDGVVVKERHVDL
jgi:hypothetical protein